MVGGDYPSWRGRVNLPREESGVQGLWRVRLSRGKAAGQKESRGRKTAKAQGRGQAAARPGAHRALAGRLALRVRGRSGAWRARGPPPRRGGRRHGPLGVRADARVRFPPAGRASSGAGPASGCGPRPRPPPAPSAPPQGWRPRERALRPPPQAGRPALARGGCRGPGHVRAAARPARARGLSWRGGASRRLPGPGASAGRGQARRWAPGGDGARAAAARGLPLRGGVGAQAACPVIAPRRTAQPNGLRACGGERTRDTALPRPLGLSSLPSSSPALLSVPLGPCWPAELSEGAWRKLS